MRDRVADIAMIAVMVVLGLAFCWLWAGPVVLDPTSTGWLQAGDRAMHTLGWWYFREAPWGVPPGANPLLGLELSSSVALSDSLPLFAMPFKLVAASLPEHFQYWGIWFALSFALQAVLGYLIARELGLGRGLALLAGLFCLIQPAFLNRIGGHMALGGHWTVLAAIYLYVRRVPPRAWAWPLLLSAVSAIHGYLLAMCFGLWVAALAQRWWLKRTSRPLLAVEAALVVAAIVAVLWATGTLMVSSLGSGGYGVYRMNLLSLFDSEGWSRFWPDLPQRSGDYEGINFPGVGIIALIVVALALAPRPDWRALLTPQWLPLAVICAGLTVFAITNHIGIAGLNLPAIPIPEPIGRFAQIFRSSGRMFWPVGYLILFVAVLLAARRLGRWAVPVLVVLLLGQAIDSSQRWTGFRAEAERMGTAWTDRLADPAWDVLGEHYARVRGLPVKLQHPGWLELSSYALEHGIGTDAVYLGRVDAKAYAARLAAVEQQFATGSFEADSIYVLDLMSALRIAPLMQPGDLLARLDELIVFARGGQTLLAEAGIEVEQYVPELNTLPAGTRIEITTHTQTDYLLAGWSGREDWGVWTEGDRALLAFKSAIDGPSHLVVRAMGYLRDRNVPQQVSVLVNGQPAVQMALERTAGTFVVPLPDLEVGQDVRVDLIIGDPTSPAERYGTGDNRVLGLGLRWFEQQAGAAPTVVGAP